MSYHAYRYEYSIIKRLQEDNDADKYLECENTEAHIMTRPELS